MAFIQITQENIDSVLESLKGQDVVFDTETTSKDPLRAKLIHIQLGSLTGQDVYWVGGPLCFQVVEYIIRNADGLIAHNLVYDTKVMYWNLFEPNEDLLSLMCSKLWDTKIGLKLTDENRDADLDGWVQENYQDNYKEVFWSRNKNYQDAPEAEQVEYGCRDIVYTRLLVQYIEQHPETVPSLLDHVQEFNRKLVNVSVKGLILDRDYLMSLGIELQESITKVGIELQDAAAHAIDLVRMDKWAKAAEKVKTAKAKANRPKPEFNWNSTHDIKALLYDKLKLPPQKSYKTKEISVDDEALEKLAPLHPVAEKLRDYRTYTKMYGSFVEGVFEKSRMVNGTYLVHPEFNPVGTVTLRTSCTGPNFQQVPADSLWGKLRGMLVPPPGHKIITCDYRSLEVYLAAALSKDPTLLGVCEAGTSFHDATLEGMKEYPQVDRGMCKAMNFAIMYGATEYRVAKITKTNIDTARKILAAFWARYPGLKVAVDACHVLVDQGLPIETAYGNKRRPSGGNVDAAKREAFNFELQSTGAGVTNRAFVHADNELRRIGIGHCIIPLHDEIIAVVKEEYVLTGKCVIKAAMEDEAKKLNLVIDLIAVASEPKDRWTK